MKKLLYITDQDEYVDHSFITPLFEIYLKKHMTVDIVYFTEFKSDFERKDTHRFTLPSRYKNILISELQRNNLLMESYDFVIVRNNSDIMQHILKHRETYHYKALFRFSFPKRRAKIHYDKVKNRRTLLNKVLHSIKTNSETKIINQCDAFLPTSHSMHRLFFPKVNIPTIECPPGINPQMLHPNIQHSKKEKRFFYAGTLDKVRKFKTILKAFSKIEEGTWRLTISTRDTEYAHALVAKHPHIKAYIEIHNPKNKETLLEGIANADVGIALLPHLPIYYTSTPVKIFDYYTSTIPCLMTDEGHTNRIFTDCYDAWFCPFEVNAIQAKLEYIISLSKEEIALVGVKGQQRLLDIRNYEKIADNLAKQLEAL